MREERQAASYFLTVFSRVSPRFSVFFLCLFGIVSVETTGEPPSRRNQSEQQDGDLPCRRDILAEKDHPRLLR
jgi:hypothetical protein